MLREQTKIIESYIEEKKMEELKALLKQAQEMEILDIFAQLTEKHQLVVFRLLEKNAALALFEDLDTDEQRHLVESFTDESATEFINQMAPDDRVKLLDELPANIAKKILSQISKEEREVTNLLLGFKEETAGRIMTTEFVALNRKLTVTQATKKVKEEAPATETIYTLFITSDTKQLEGVLSLRDLIVADPQAILEDIMSDKVIKVSTDTDQEEVANLLQTLDLLAVPVVDSEERLVGIVTFDDAMDVLRDETTEDILKSAGLDSTKEKEHRRSGTLINGGLFAIWKIRIPILLIVLAGGFVAGMIVEGFEEVLEAATVIAFFIPLIMDMGGSVGGQSTTIFARGFVLGHIKAEDFWKQFRKEALVGITIGGFIGFFAYFGVGFWLGDWSLGLAVGLALIANCLIAASAGFLVPFFLIKIGADQAAGSGPIITSIKDITGLLVYFLLIITFIDVEAMAAPTPQEAVGYAIEALDTLHYYAYHELPNATREALEVLQGLLEGEGLQ